MILYLLKLILLDLFIKLIYFAVDLRFNSILNFLRLLVYLHLVNEFFFLLDLDSQIKIYPIVIVKQRNMIDYLKSRLQKQTVDNDLVSEIVKVVQSLFQLLNVLVIFVDSH